MEAEDIKKEYPIPLDVKTQKNLKSFGEVATTAQEIMCPECGSSQIRQAGYGDRLQCIECEKIFT